MDKQRLEQRAEFIVNRDRRFLIADLCVSAAGGLLLAFVQVDLFLLINFQHFWYILFWNDIVVIYRKEKETSEIRTIILWLIPSAVAYVVCWFYVSSGWLRLLFESIAMIWVCDYCYVIVADTSQLT